MKGLKRFTTLIIAAAFTLSVIGCGSQNAVEAVDEEVAVSENVETGEETVETETEEAEEEAVTKGGKQVIVYYPNWYLGKSEATAGGEVGSIAWDSVTIINHAFFESYPADGTTDSSWKWRSDGKEPRTQFKCVSTLPAADFDDQEISEYNDSPRNHFTQYEIYSEMYPDVNIMISVGGWTACGYFSEMAYTKEGRASFIESCVDLINTYPWIDGIDIDWEYPAGSPDGERLPESDDDEGCPIWGTPKEDNENFTSLLKEMREAFNENFGEGEKLITACASGSTGWTLPCQDWPSFAPHLDYINIMTYDLAGKWDKKTGHASSTALTKSGLAFFVTRGIESSKLNIGSPLYPTWFLVLGDDMPSSVVGAPINTAANMTLGQFGITDTQNWEKESVKGYEYGIVDGKYVRGENFDNSNEGEVRGWNFGYDKIAGDAYMYNNDPESDFYMWYASYENPVSLQEKLDLIERFKLAGIIVWESTKDTDDHLMVSWMNEFLNGTEE